LLKADTRIAPLGGGPSVFTEFYYTDYRQYGDYKHWRIREEWRDGKAFEQMTVTEANLYTQAHELLFKTPDIEEKLPAVIAEYHVRDRRDFVRRSVAAIGPGEGSDFTRLVAALKNKEPVKSKVRRALVVWGDLARGGNAAPLAAADLDALVALLKTKDDAELQMIGVEGAASLGAQAKDVAAPLAGVAREARDPKLLAGAFLAFRAIGAKDDDTIALMQKHASHADAAVRDAVGLALLKLAPERISIGVAAELMSSPSAEIRTSAGKIMQQQLEKVTVNDLPVLRNGLKNQGREVRLTFIEAIGKLKEEGRAAAPELTALLGLADEEVARQAALTLHQMGKLTEAARGVTDAKA
jgi:hypothetical protein